MKNIKKDIVSLLALFTSTGTLLCCAMPVAIATFAGGAAVASLASSFPFLITLSRYKFYIFLVAGILLFISGFLIYRPRKNDTCPAYEGNCEVAGRFSKFTFWISLFIFSVGFFFAYLSVPLMRWLGI